MSNIVGELFDQKLSAVTLQLAILVANAYILLETSGERPWSVASAIIILCLLSLQIVHRRFLMFYPVRVDFNIPTPSLDTYVLRYGIITALWALLVGFASQQKDAAYWLSIGSGLLFIGLPTYWMFWGGKECVDKEVVATIEAESGEHVQIRKCPCSSDKNPHCQKVTRTFVGPDSIETTVDCQTCGYHETSTTSARVAY